MENSSTLTALFHAYLNGECSTAEVERLLQYFEIAQHEPLLRTLILNELETYDATLEPHREKELNIIYDHIRSRIQANRTIPIYRRRWVQWAAAVLVLLAGSAFFFAIHSGRHQQGMLARNEPTETNYTRHVTLPDGSTVIIHAGGILDYSPTFNGTTREVTLQGEAYFDIKTNLSKPFIIHTGKLRTTVLGTSFNIQSAHDRITITVTSGKVKVEDATKLLAVLTPDRQLVFDLQKDQPVAQPVRAEQTIAWTGHDMHFDGASFDSITQQMSRRYQVSIGFTNDAIRKCPITAAFNGTESLEEVLTVLCTARNASYTIKDGQVMIDGKACDQ